MRGPCLPISVGVWDPNFDKPHLAHPDGLITLASPTSHSLYVSTFLTLLEPHLPFLFCILPVECPLTSAQKVAESHLSSAHLPVGVIVTG